MQLPAVRRSTYGAAAGSLAAVIQYAVIPPTVIQEFLLLTVGWAVSVDFAAFLGTAIVGFFGWLSTRLAPDQPGTAYQQEVTS